MEEELLIKLETEVNNELNKYDKECSRALRIEAVRKKLLKPQGLFGTRCPACKSKLTKRLYYFGDSAVTYWFCLCGYEYAKV